MTKQEFIDLFHKQRKANKGQWFTLFEQINGEAIALKAYGTWIQRLEYKGFKDSGPMDCKVKEVTAYLQNTL
jgi:hypothetical protein